MPDQPTANELLEMARDGYKIPFGVDAISTFEALDAACCARNLPGEWQDANDVAEASLRVNERIAELEAELAEAVAVLWRIAARRYPNDEAKGGFGRTLEPLTNENMRRNLTECVRMAADLVPPEYPEALGKMVPVEKRLTELRQKLATVTAERDAYKRDADMENDALTRALQNKTKANRELGGKIRALEAVVEAAYDAGWADGIRLYAVWKNGEQLVGVMQRPLKTVLAEGSQADHKRAALSSLPKNQPQTQGEA